MPRRMRRAGLLVLLVLASAVLAGCGNRHEGPRLLAETEGVYLEIGDLSYQVQVSRELNPQDTEDQQYLRGLSSTVLPATAQETYFGVFLRVQNQKDEPKLAAKEFEIEDTLGKTYAPLAIDPDVNPFVYRQSTLPPGQVLPLRESPAGEGPIGGSLLLFKIPLDAFFNRPLEFKIVSPTSDQTGIVDLDV
jgi:hypothetical protein